MKRLSLISVLCVFGLFLSGCGLFSSPGPKIVFHSTKGNTTLKVEVADDFDSRKRGLMYRSSLAADSGMIFVFDSAAIQTFWMKNTLIPLDMVFVGADYKIVDIIKNVPPCEVKDCPVYPSKRPAQYVVEVNAGYVDKIGLANGDSLEFVK